METGTSGEEETQYEVFENFPGLILYKVSHAEI